MEIIINRSKAALLEGDCSVTKAEGSLDWCTVSLHPASRGPHASLLRYSLSNYFGRFALNHLSIIDLMCFFPLHFPASFTGIAYNGVIAWHSAALGYHCAIAVDRPLLVGLLTMESSWWTLRPTFCLYMSRSLCHCFVNRCLWTSK